MKVTHYLSIFAITAIIASCTKGDTGPAGPVGATGTTGANGVSNISTMLFMVTGKATPTDSAWVVASTPAYHWISSCKDTDITANNVDAVEVYWTTTLGTGWNTLPVTSLINPGDELSFRYNNDTISFKYYTGGSAILPPSSNSNYGTIFFKVVTIPPVLQMNYPGTNWRNASEAAMIPEVKAALN